MPIRLKSLELQGYKTFAARTEFAFAGKITAIVGPNGSGKSNIADSIRWVLGEQSYSLLRGKKTEDMIFAGSEQRPRAGMASATILFDNEDGWLPIDFGEVAVTRRAYRDGTNEYLINGQRVRLRDVSELLAQSGLAERTYTIIGQGLVDAALALKAEERRRLFEEAAGTGLHRSRREEALRRLDTTKRNLERVQDILAELRPRLRSLERQARRAREYEQVKADLRVLLREWYGYHWHRAQRELTQAQRSVRERRHVLEDARRLQADLDAQVGDLRERSQSLRASLNSWHRQSAQVHTRRESIGRELAVLAERLRALDGQETNARQEINRLGEEIALRQERLEEADREINRLKAEQEEAKEQLAQAAQDLEHRRTVRTRAKQDAEKAEQALASLQSQRGELLGRVGALESQVDQSRRTFEQVEPSLLKAESNLQLASESARKAEAQAEHAGNEFSVAEEDLHAQNSRVEEIRQEIHSLEERQASIMADGTRLEAERKVLAQAEDALQGYTEGTRLLLDAARRHQLGETRGALSAYLEAPAELETAIAASLGEYLDAVLLDGDPSQALDLLGSHAARGALLPLHSLKPREPLVIPQVDGILGIASELVQTPPELRPAVDLLLGQTLIVEDRQAAHRALNASPPPARVVTLKGEVYFGSGPVLIGGPGEESALGRRRRMRDLADQAADLERKTEQMDRTIQERNEQLARQRERTADAERRLQEARTELQTHREGLRQAVLKQEQADRQLAWYRQECSRLQDDISRAERELSELGDQLLALDESVSRAQEARREHTASLSDLSLDDIAEQHAHWNTRVAVIERGVQDAITRHEERRIASERSQRLLEQAQAQLTSLDEARTQYHEEQNERRKEESELTGEIEKLRYLIDPAEKELEAVEKQRQELRESESEARKRLSSAEQNYAQARINLARRQEGLESLRQRIEDDFGLVAFEYDDQVSGPTPLPFEGMVEELPRVTELSAEVEEALRRQRAQLRRMGAINQEAQAEYEEVKQRFEFLTSQVEDLQHAEADVRRVIAELDELMQREFLKTFEAVAEHFHEIFMRLFGGGSARLVLTDPDNLSDTGIDIEARLPGRRTQGLSLLSGGERSLTATALVFSLLKVSPTPFCLLDEVDAMLDEANVGRFRDLLRELSGETQFVIVTHNRNTVQAAEVIYGVTMGRDSTSQVLSLRLDQVAEVVE